MEIIKNKTRGEKGVSLMELLIVMVILGIIAAIAIPQLIGSRRAANQKVAVVQFSDFHRAQKAYRNDLGVGRYGTLKQLRATRPDGDPLIDSQLVDTDGSGINYKGWVIGETDPPTATTYGLNLGPGADNPATYGFCLYDDGIVRRVELVAGSGIVCSRGTGSVVNE